MSSNLPLRTFRIPPTRPPRLSHQRHHAPLSRALSTTAPRTFTCSLSHSRAKYMFPPTRTTVETSVKSIPAESPEILQLKQHRENPLVQDIGLLQDTMVRPGWDDLPSVWSHEFWHYMWKLFKSKGTALYSRSYYNRCMHKKGMSRFVAVDAFKSRELKDKARTLYVTLCANYASGNISYVSQFCLPPILKAFKDRIAARGPLSMDIQFTKPPSITIMSHRASIFGDSFPDTAIRQVVFRIQSMQKIVMKHGASKPSNVKGLKWIPADVKSAGKKEKANGTKGQKILALAEETKPEKVVEYFVLQRRVIEGKEEEWKIWGFTQGSTLRKVQEDEEYWHKMLALRV